MDQSSEYVVGFLLGAGVNRGIALCLAQSMSDLRTQSNSIHNFLQRRFFSRLRDWSITSTFDQSTWHKMQKIIETGFASLDGCYFASTQSAIISQHWLSLKCQVLALSLFLSLLTMQCLQSRTYSLVHMSVISRSVNLCFFGILGWECFHHHSNSLKFPDTFLKHFWELPYKLCKHDKKKNHGKYQKIVDYACVFSSAIYLQWWLLSSREAQIGLPCLLSTHLIS